MIDLAKPAPTAGVLAPSLGEIFRTIPVSGTKLRRAFSFFGPGYLVAVGYMDPGNWATDIYGGSAFGYTLLVVVVMSNFMAMILQHLAIRLGVASGRDLAQACRENYSKPVAMMLWILCEIAIVFCDLAELIGTAIALELLFGIPMVYGAILTTLDVFALLYLTRRGFRALEAVVIVMITSVFVAFSIQLAMASPDMAEMAKGLYPSRQIISNPEMLYAAIGIIGATVMPHNLYLHSSVVQSRAYERNDAGKKEAIFFATVDSTVALLIALFINAAILIVAASAFHGGGRVVLEIQDAYRLLPAALGASSAATLFALALLVSGQNSAITATMAGQIVMEGFVKFRLSPGVRRLVTRGLALIPTIFALAVFGETIIAKLLLLSQVVLSLQLPFAIIPLIRFCQDKKMMGKLAIGPVLKIVSMLVCATILACNIRLIQNTFF